MDYLKCLPIASTSNCTHGFGCAKSVSIVVAPFSFGVATMPYSSPSTILKRALLSNCIMLINVTVSTLQLNCLIVMQFSQVGKTSANRCPSDSEAPTPHYIINPKHPTKVVCSSFETIQQHHVDPMRTSLLPGRSAYNYSKSDNSKKII